jgi:hypothetical protein
MPAVQLAISDATLARDGLFLVGLGALLVVGGQVAWGAPRGLDGMPMVGARRHERWGWALNLTGAALLAGGSAMVMIGNWPTWQFIVGTAAVMAGAIWVAHWSAGRRAASGEGHRRRDRDAGSSGDPLRLFLGGALVAGAVLIGLELWCADLRDWFRDRPVLVGLATAFLVVTPAVLGLERWIASSQARRWQRTAINGVETFLWHASRFHDRVRRLMLSTAGRLGTADEGLDYSELLEGLARDDPGFFMRELSPIAQEEANNAGQLILTAASAMALYPPLADYIDRLWSVERLMRGVDDMCYGIGFVQGTRTVITTRATAPPRFSSSGIVIPVGEASHLVRVRCRDPR